MIGIFGGTFDPVHVGHLRVALELLEKYRLKEIRFIPCKDPVLKKHAPLPAKHRLAMLKLAIKGQPGFVVDDSELKRKTPSYMIDTLCTLQEKMPKERFALIMGGDAFTSFPQWQCYDDIMAMAQLLIVPRNTLETLPISSSQIRKCVKAGKSARYLVPDSVWDYIDKHGLYR